DPERALVLHEQGLVLRRSLGDRRGEAMTLHNLAALFDALGEPRRAAELFERALALHRETGDRTSEAATLSSWGNALEQLGAPERALALYEEALALRRALGSRNGEAVILANLGWVSRTLGKSEEALQRFEQAMALAREQKRPLSEAEALLGRGAILADRGQPARALEDTLRARALAREAASPAREAEALYRTALVQRTMGDLDATRASIESALDLVESIRFKLSSPDLRASLRATIQAYYELYIDLLMEHHRRDRGQGADRAALAASERARARGLVELLAAAGAPPVAGAEPGLLERERALRQALKVELWRGPEGAGTAAGLLDRYRQLEAEMRSASRTFALTSPEPLSLEDLQSHLGGDDTLLLAYALGSERSYLWAVTTGSFASYELPSRAGIEDAARRLHRLLASPDRRAVQRQVELAAAELSRLLLAPVASQLAGRRLVIVPDGALHYVPFAVLPEPGDAAATPLIVGHEIAVLPSASVLPLLRRERPDPPSADHRIAVLADPVFDRNDPRVRRPATPAAPAGTARLLRSTVPGGGRLDRLTFSRVEAQRILAAAPPGTGLAALDFEANREKVVSGDLAGYSILHFATHGLVDGERPERSGIVLSLVDEQGRERDGFVRLGDLYGLDLAADLVVLSACRSALGEEIHGEGLVGLTRGFMAAGAARVVASLWDVEDEATAELMSRFYRGLLRDGLPPAAALRRAQLELARERRWESPAFWAGFVLQGDWR
ncbi:MAG TPA: CHAT domain-containing tetratricopeptide repeat protein, partial [Thermoanaerobaculia bacterium]|nr:CHAT domain-containing tetratricopeptide repeat protein [Thermoanaerobaculia bacterium]